MSEKAMVATEAAGTPAVYDEATIARLTGMANPSDAPMASGPDVLKINYDEESAHKRGVWVLGQRKDQEGNITDEGEVVTHILILTTRNRYSYYDQDTKDSVSSMMFENGRQPADKAECDRKILAYPKAKLKWQTVVLGLAIVGGAYKEFIYYAGGVSYVAIRDYMKELTVYIRPDGTKTSPVPPFIYVTELTETVKKKNGTISYWVPTFKKGKEVPVPQLDFLEEKRKAAYEFIEFSNGRASNAAPAASAPPAHGVGDMPEYTPPAAAPPADAPMPWEATGSAETVVPEAVPAPTEEPAAEDYDIEAAMLNIVNG